MTDFENAIVVMNTLFGKDQIFALSTCSNNRPSARFVDAYFDGESFYIVTNKLTKKVSEILDNPNVSLCSNKMYSFDGQAVDLGHPLKEENAGLRDILTKVFETWYFRHCDESDENMCYIRIDPTTGFFHKDGKGYRMNFTEKTVDSAPFKFDIMYPDQIPGE